MNNVEFRIGVEGRNALDRICSDVYHSVGEGPVDLKTLEKALWNSRSAYENMVAMTLFYRQQAQGSTLDPIDTEDVMRWLLTAVNHYCAYRHKHDRLEAEAEEAETA